MGNLHDIQVVLFDVGGVLVTVRPNPNEIVEILGGDPTDQFLVELVDNALWAKRTQHDIGMCDREFWDTVAGNAGFPEVTDEKLEKLIDADTQRMTVIDAPTEELLATLKEKGYQLGIVTNAPLCIATAIRGSRWFQDYFTHASFSSEKKVTKAQLGLFRDAVDLFNVEPYQIVFVDDGQKNLQSAEFAGLSTVHWDGIEGSGRQQLNQLPDLEK